MCFTLFAVEPKEQLSTHAKRMNMSSRAFLQTIFNLISSVLWRLNLRTRTLRNRGPRTLTTMGNNVYPHNSMLNKVIPNPVKVVYQCWIHNKNVKSSNCRVCFCGYFTFLLRGYIFNRQRLFHMKFCMLVRSFGVRSFGGVFVKFGKLQKSQRNLYWGQAGAR